MTHSASFMTHCASSEVKMRGKILQGQILAPQKNLSNPSITQKRTVRDDAQYVIVRHRGHLQSTWMCMSGILLNNNHINSNLNLDLQVINIRN